VVATAAGSKKRTENPVAESKQKWRASVETAGDMAMFSLATLRAVPGVRHHLPEVFKQAAILILSSGPIIWVLNAMSGTICGIEADYVLRTLGANSISGVFGELCDIRIVGPFMFGYIVAAKVGCGLVAEIGSMRIADEIDALEVLGVPSLRYLVAVRLVAGWIAGPFIFFVGAVISYQITKFIPSAILGSVSTGQFDVWFWGFATPFDLFALTTKAIFLITVLIGVGCYYGYTARGGPAGVGWNTAKCMMVSLVIIHVADAAWSQIFWGYDMKMPLAN
jgi:phospholipid/cholesterol/gamma-HCH transport system permease protein